MTVAEATTSAALIFQAVGGLARLQVKVVAAGYVGYLSSFAQGPTCAASGSGHEDDCRHANGMLRSHIMCHHALFVSCALVNQHAPVADLQT